MEPSSNSKISYSRLQSRWRNSINQFTKLSEESKLTKLDTVFKNTSKLKLKMKNRLGQIDEEFNPILMNKKSPSIKTSKNVKNRVTSTHHDTNIFTTNSLGTNLNLEQSLIIENNPLNPEEFNQNLIYKCHQIRQELIQELTEYNNSRYTDEMQQHCSKYNQSMKSILYSIIDHPKKQLYEFCYICDEILSSKNKSNKPQLHSCKAPITSISRVNEALKKLKSCVDTQDNKIFHVFLHNALQHETTVEQLVTNVTVLKQSLELQYEPEEALLRLRLMNLIGKKIGLLMEENELEERLNSLWRSKR